MDYIILGIKTFLYIYIFTNMQWIKSFHYFIYSLQSKTVFFVFVF